MLEGSGTAVTSSPFTSTYRLAPKPLVIVNGSGSDEAKPLVELAPTARLLTARQVLSEGDPAPIYSTPIHIPPKPGMTWLFRGSVAEREDRVSGTSAVVPCIPRLKEPRRSRPVKSPDMDDSSTPVIGTA